MIFMKKIIKFMIILSSIAVTGFVLVIAGYVGMILYFAHKDDTTYRYNHYRCDGKSFTIPLKMALCQYSDTKNVYLYERSCSDPRYVKTLKYYLPNTKFTFIALYSTYDFETGVIYKYLIKDTNDTKMFLDFDDIDPKYCQYDTNNTYWYHTGKTYLPSEGENAKKVEFKKLKELFNTNK